LAINSGLAVAFLLALAVPVLPASAQNNSTVPDDITDLLGNLTGSADLDSENELPANDTETLAAADDIVINEVELNPRGSDVGREWIELYNPSESDANVSGFEIMTSFKSAVIRLPPGAEIEANGTYVVELDRQTLSNTAESLVLEDGAGDVIDRTPSLVDRSDDGRTWQRIPDGGSEWQFAAGTKEELNDPEGQVKARSARSGPAECEGSAGCAEGMVTRIVDGDTLYVRVNGTTYKVDLALASAPARSESGYAESRSFTQSLCFGSSVLIDQDDLQLTSATSVIAVVYCGSSNLNSELLDSGNAVIDSDQCETSEFAGQRWARDHGC
jgi:endonuclease YncB( thermonuclease family)